MIYMKNLIVLLVAVALVAPSALGDIISTGNKPVNYCFQIENIEQYPDYIFFISSPRPEYAHGKIINSECARSISSMGFTIYSVEKSNYNEEYFVWLDYQADYDFNVNKTKLGDKLIQYELMLYGVRSIQENDPTTEIKDILEIKSITDSKLDVQKTKRVFTFNDGTTEEQVYTNQEIAPESSKKPIFPWWFNELLVFLSAIAAIIMIIVLIVRRFRK